MVSQIRSGCGSGPLSQLWPDRCATCENPLERPPSQPASPPDGPLLRVATGHSRGEGAGSINLTPGWPLSRATSEHPRGEGAGRSTSPPGWPLLRVASGHSRGEGAGSINLTPRMAALRVATGQPRGEGAGSALHPPVAAFSGPHPGTPGVKLGSSGRCAGPRAIRAGCPPRRRPGRPAGPPAQDARYLSSCAPSGRAGVAVTPQRRGCWHARGQPRSSRATSCRAAHGPSEWPGGDRGPSLPRSARKRPPAISATPSTRAAIQRARCGGPPELLAAAEPRRLAELALAPRADDGTHDRVDVGRLQVRRAAAAAARPAEQVDRGDRADVRLVGARRRERDREALAEPAVREHRDSIVDLGVPDRAQPRVEDGRAVRSGDLEQQLDVGARVVDDGGLIGELAAGLRAGDAVTDRDRYRIRRRNGRARGAGTEPPAELLLRRRPGC